MIYKARVISNNDFSTTGKIKVRVFKETMPELWKPLTEIPDSIKEANTLIKDDSGSFYVRSSEAEAYVFSMFGGGIDYGFFSLPQPNSLGIVAPIENENKPDIIEYVWLGSASFPIDGLPRVPSDSERDTSSGVIPEEGFVIKTKSTNIPLDGIINGKIKSEYFDFARKGFDNYISATQNGIVILNRLVQEDRDGVNHILGVSKVTLNSSGIKGEFTPYEDDTPNTDTNSSFSFGNNGEINIYRTKKDEGSVTIKLGSETNTSTNKDGNIVRISIANKDGNVDFLMNDTSIESALNGNSLKLTKSDGIFITAADKQPISFDADLINLGSSGKSVVLVDNALADVMGTAGFTGDGVTFFASGNVKA